MLLWQCGEVCTSGEANGQQTSLEPSGLSKQHFKYSSSRQRCLSSYSLHALSTASGVHGLASRFPPNGMEAQSGFAWTAAETSSQQATVDSPWRRQHLTASSSSQIWQAAPAQPKHSASTASGSQALLACIKLRWQTDPARDLAAAGQHRSVEPPWSKQHFTFSSSRQNVHSSKPAQLAHFSSILLAHCDRFPAAKEDRQSGNVLICASATLQHFSWGTPLWRQHLTCSRLRQSCL